MEALIKFFKALSDPTRLRIVRLLLERELCVCELMFILKMEQSRISHQLRILRDADLVEDCREGRWMTYRIPANVRKTLAPLFGQLVRSQRRKEKEMIADLKNLKVCLREDIRRKRKPIGPA